MALGTRLATAAGCQGEGGGGGGGLLTVLALLLGLDALGWRRGRLALVAAILLVLCRQEQGGGKRGQARSAAAGAPHPFGIAARAECRAIAGCPPAYPLPANTRCDASAACQATGSCPAPLSLYGVATRPAAALAAPRTRLLLLLLLAVLHHIRPKHVPRVLGLVQQRRTVAVVGRGALGRQLCAWVRTRR